MYVISSSQRNAGRGRQTYLAAYATHAFLAACVVSITTFVFDPGSSQFVNNFRLSSSSAGASAVPHDVPRVLSGGDHLDETLHTNALCSEQVLGTFSLGAIMPTMWQSELDSDNMRVSRQHAAFGLQYKYDVYTLLQGLVEKVAPLHLHTFVAFLIVSTRNRQITQVSRPSSLQTPRRADSEMIDVGCGTTPLAENRHLSCARCWTTNSSFPIERKRRGSSTKPTMGTEFIFFFMVELARFMVDSLFL